MPSQSIPNRILAYTFRESTIEDVKSKLESDASVTSIIGELRRDTLERFGLDGFKKGLKLYRCWYWNRVNFEPESITATFTMPILSRGLNYKLMLRSAQLASQMHGLFRRAIWRIVAESQHPVFQSRAMEASTILPSSTYLMYWRTELLDDWEWAVREVGLPAQQKSGSQGPEAHPESSKVAEARASEGGRSASEYFQRASGSLQVAPERAYMEPNTTSSTTGEL